jgi:hypothetical protein
MTDCTVDRAVTSGSVPASLPALLLRLTCLLGLCVLGACGGTAQVPAPAPKVATGIVYTDPPAGGWRLVRNASSTSTRLVLDLIGPTGTKGRGVGFNLRSDGTVRFAKFASGSYINDLGVFQLTNKHGATSVVTGQPVANDVGAIVGGIKEQGRVLTVGAFQKDRRWPAQALDQPLFQVAIEFDPAQASAHAGGEEIPLTFLRARSIPENIGDNPEDPKASVGSWAYDYRIDEVQVSVGTLHARWAL